MKKVHSHLTYSKQLIGKNKKQVSQKRDTTPDIIKVQNKRKGVQTMNTITIIFKSGSLVTTEYVYQYTDKVQLTVIDKDLNKHIYDIQDISTIRINGF